MNRKVLIAGAFLVIPLILLLVLGLRRDPTIIDSPLVGKQAPPFDLTTFDGAQVISRQSLSGRPAVINFWASWCAPCYAEHPVLVNASRDLAGEVSFVGVIYEDTDENIERFLSRMPPFGPTLTDPGGKAAIAYGVYGAPETFFLDSDGVVVAKHTGALTPELMESYLRQAGVPAS